MNLNFPGYAFRTRNQQGRTEIWDEWRKIWVLLTPEEEVRQHLTRFLSEERGFPGGLMALEKSLDINGLKKRADVVVYSREGQAVLLAECKAPMVKISQETFDQASRYNLVFRVPYLLVSNGMQHYCARIDQGGVLTFLKDIPHFDELKW